MDIFSQFVGFIGMLFVVLAYHNVSRGKWDGASKIFNITNLIGAILLIFSLLFHFNLGSFMIEIVWIFVAIRALKCKKKI